MDTTINKWIEIDTRALINNLNEVRSLLDEKVRLIAVIKANAYGHGAVGTARILEQQGVDFFAVTYLEEAMQLRKSGISSDILLLSPLTGLEGFHQAIAAGLTISITSEEDAAHLLQAITAGGQDAVVHVKVETGLGRFGMKKEAISKVCQSLQSCPQIKLEGIYTHMADAAVSDYYTKKQFAIFCDIINHLENQGITIPIKHCANSATTVKYPAMHMDAVRVGTLLSGHYPTGVAGKLSLRDPFCFRCRILSVKEASAGDYLGYYRTYRLKKHANIAVIPVGYVDGLMLQVGNPPAGFIDWIKILAKGFLSYFDIARLRTEVEIKGQKYPVRGKVFMQMALLEISRNADVRAGMAVDVPVKKTLTPVNIKRFYKFDDTLVSEEQLILTDNCSTGRE